MAADPNAVADEGTLTFDLGNLFEENSVEIKQIDTTYIQDSDFINLMNDVGANNTKIQQNPGADVAIADDAASAEIPKGNRFLDLNDNKINEIANLNTKQKTKKQTIWGLKVFQGTFHCLFIV